MNSIVIIINCSGLEITICITYKDDLFILPIKEGKKFFKYLKELSGSLGGLYQAIMVNGLHIGGQISTHRFKQMFRYIPSNSITELVSEIDSYSTRTLSSIIMRKPITVYINNLIWYILFHFGFVKART